MSLKGFKIADWLIYAAVLGLIVFHAMRSSDDLAPITPPELGEALPGISPRDPSIVVQLDVLPSDGSGTAFSIDEQGTWLTARHVVDGCDAIGLISGARSAVRVDEVELSETGDFATLKTRWGRDPLASDIRSNRVKNELGFFPGFPQGTPGEVAGSLLGRHTLITQGRYNRKEPVLAWAEVSRTRGLTGSLSGLSGAPALDVDGEVIGVVTAESPRRGRVYTVDPSAIRSVMPYEYDQAEAEPIALETYGMQADSFRRDRRIAQVICLVD